MIEKINPYSIALEHILTLKSNKTGNFSLSNIVLFFIFPLFLALPIAIRFKPTESLVDILVTSLSVFAALLFNLLLLTLDAIKKAKETISTLKKAEEPIQSNERVLLLMKQTYFNISYAVLISLISITIILSAYILELEFGSLIQQVFWTINYFLIINFILTMAMILKRMHIILIEMMK